MKRYIDKLFMITAGEIPYGTIVSVVREHKSKNHWIVTEAETDKSFIVSKADVQEI